MPSRQHEALIELFRHRPALATELLTGPLGIPIPTHQDIRLDSGDLPDLTPTEYRADAVVTLTHDDKPVLSVVIEIPPAVTDPAQAADSPELAVLSAMAHATHPEQDKIFRALLTALSTTEHGQATLYADVVLAVLPQAARQHLEALMTSATYEYQSDFARRYFSQGKAEGEAKGKAEALLTVLAARGIDVPEPARQRITERADADLLDTWIRRATTASTLDEIFA